MIAVVDGETITINEGKTRYMGVGRDRDTCLCRQKVVSLVVEESKRSAGKERRAVVALISEGFSSETDPAGLGTGGERGPAGVEIPAGGWTGRSAVFGSSPQPSGLHDLQAGFTAARPAAN